MKDQEIIELAIFENRIIVTKDQDFLDHYLMKGSPPTVLMIQTGNASNRVLLSLVQHNRDLIMGMFSEGAEVILLSKAQITQYRNTSSGE